MHSFQARGGQTGERHDLDIPSSRVFPRIQRQMTQHMDYPWQQAGLPSPPEPAGLVRHNQGRKTTVFKHL